MVTVEKSKEQLYELVEKLQYDQIEKVLLFAKFIEFEKMKDLENNTSLSQQSLAKDWLSPEEDSAWENL